MAATTRQSPGLTTFLVNRAMRFLVMQFGFEGKAEPDTTRILRVQDHTSRRLYDLPVRIVTMNGRRYFMAAPGDAWWIDHVRAAAAVELISRGADETVRAREIEGEERISFWDWYCRNPQYAIRARTALAAAIDHLTLAELERLGRTFPVFRLEPILLAYAG